MEVTIILLSYSLRLFRVREMFEGKDEQKAKLSLHSLLENEATNVRESYSYYNRALKATC